MPSVFGHRILPLFLLSASLWGALFFSLHATAADTSYLTELQERARRERLSCRPEWRSLLHYTPAFFRGEGSSRVDSDVFFLSPDGRRDPQAELDATLAAFFREASDDGEEHAQCIFVARYAWLKQFLSFDASRLPELPCRQFMNWRDEMNAEGLTLVFATAYLNNPASMFGHTLLRIDSRDQNNQTRLLANTINFAADSGGQRGVRFAFKGLFGMYQGKYSITPYYLKVKTYNDIENRDIWEYRLKLTPDEIDRLLRHVWEMRQASFDYYFADENCSYQLLSLLDNARFGMGLTDRFSLWAVPSETIRAVADAGLVDTVNFRTARSTMLRERTRTMDSQSLVLARKLADAELKPDSEPMLELDDREQARVIELAVDYAAYRQTPRAGSAELPSGLLRELLERRSRLQVSDQTPSVAAPRIPPGKGHKPARCAVGFGIENRQHFIQVDFGPGYHGLFDPNGGYTRGAQINALHTTVRYYPEDGTGKLERFDVVDIISLTSWEAFLRPVSWKANVGVVRKRKDGKDRPLMGRLNGGIGISHDFSENVSTHIFAEGTVEASDRFDYILAPGVGPAGGLLLDIGERWRNGLSFSWQQYFLHEWRDDFEVALKSRLTLQRQSIVGLELEWKREFGDSFPAGRLYWQIYF